MGRSDLYLILEILKKILYVVQIVILIRWGIMPMLWCEIAFSLVCVYLNSYFTGRDLQYGLFAQLRDFSPYPLITVPACLFAWELYWIIMPFSPWAGYRGAFSSVPAPLKESKHSIRASKANIFFTSSSLPSIPS